jgi:hypothetical protein
MAIGQYSGGIGAIAGAIVGGIVGYYTGYGAYQGAMIGASLGGMAGGVAGSVLWPEKINPEFPPPPQPNENRTQISTYGTPIPIVYESARLAGNIIYMSDVNNTVVRTSHRQDGVRYYELTQTYTSTFAIAFCEGPVTGISRIWINGKIFADWRDPSNPYYPSGSTGLASANIDASVALENVWFSTYLGTESQTHDTNMALILGAADTPAYRGICYITFINFPVGEFSGLPSVEIEIGPTVSWGTVDFTGWTEFDVYFVSENPADFLTFGSGAYSLTNAFDSYTNLYTYTTPMGAAPISNVRFGFTVSNVSGSGNTSPELFWFSDVSGSSRLYLVLGISSLSIYINSGAVSDHITYSAVTFPLSRYVELDFSVGGTLSAKVYTDSGFTTLEDTLTISGTGMASNPTITFCRVAENQNGSALNFTLAVSSVIYKAA